jgi:1L-myo-inositol 1-phosphate cytidylyltransferase
MRAGNASRAPMHGVGEMNKVKIAASNKVKAVILAAGRGSRLRELGPSKPLTHVDGIPLIERVIRSAAEGGADGIVAVTGYLGDEVRRFLDTLAARVDISIEYADNKEWHMGNGRSLLAAAPLLDGPFHVLMSDHLFDPHIMSDLRRTPLPAGGARLAVDRNLENPYVDLDDVTKVLEDGGLIREIGKTIPSYNVFDTGVFYCTPGLIAAIEASIVEHNDDSLSGGMRRLARQNKAEIMDIGAKVWIDVDDPSAHGLASRLFRQAAV